MRRCDEEVPAAEVLRTSGPMSFGAAYVMRVLRYGVRALSIWRALGARRAFLKRP